MAFGEDESVVGRVFRLRHGVPHHFVEEHRHHLVAPRHSDNPTLSKILTNLCHGRAGCWVSALAGGGHVHRVDPQLVGEVLQLSHLAKQCQALIHGGKVITT